MTRPLEHLTDEIPCEERCPIPEGVILRGVPVPRHQWNDVLVCPNDCGRAFMVVSEGDADA